MSAMAEYLKKYTGEAPSDPQKKKKKKKKKDAGAGGAARGIIIHDDDDSAWQKPAVLDADMEEAPAVVEVDHVAEAAKAEKARLDRLRAKNANNWVSADDPSTSGRHDSPDMSPPCRGRHDSPSPSPRRGGRHDSPDLSPPRRGGRHDSPDLSPPRRGGRHDSPDLSPPRRGGRQDSPDLSPPRRGGRHDSPDLSPPRRGGRHDSPDLSPPRRGGRHDSPDLSPPRRGGRQDSPDLSPPRRGREVSPDLSPPRRGREVSPDLSPPRRGREVSPDLSPPRKRGRGDDDRAGAGGGGAAGGVKKPKLMSDGTVSGLRKGWELKDEINQKKQVDARRFQDMDPDRSGKLAQTVYRSRDGKKVAMDEYVDRKRKEKGIRAETDEADEKLAWGEGLAQKRQREQRLAEMRKEADKPFARYADDPELDQSHRTQSRWGDPMAGLVKKRPEEGFRDLSRDAGVDSEAMEKSGFVIPQGIPPHSWVKRGVGEPYNRYKIRPGRHWDGVDRSNGFERDLFRYENEKKQRNSMAYAWATEDM